MAYSAIVLPVMIASPSDVLEERAVASNAIHDWNDINSVDHRVIFAPVCWETHSSPELGARPQDLINARLLAECDLLIGVFWTRIGSHTGVAISGTVEEIEGHVEKGKPAIVYFSSKPVVLDSVDPKQYQLLIEFKRKCMERGLIDEYSDIVEFERKVGRHLSLVLRKNEYLRKVVETNSQEQIAGVSGPSGNSGAGLSDDAVELLCAASLDRNGIILRVDSFRGRTFSTNKKNFGSESAREAARWDSALVELEKNKLVVPKGYKGEVFELTHLGWELADRYCSSGA